MKCNDYIMVTLLTTSEKGPAMFNRESHIGGGCHKIVPLGIFKGQKLKSASAVGKNSGNWEHIVQVDRFGTKKMQRKF